jgi:hypothetical protein
MPKSDRVSLLDIPHSIIGLVQSFIPQPSCAHSPVSLPDDHGVIGKMEDCFQANPSSSSFLLCFCQNILPC